MEPFLLLALIVLAFIVASQIGALKRRLAATEEILNLHRLRLNALEADEKRAASAPEYRPSVPETSPVPPAAPSIFERPAASAPRPSIVPAATVDAPSAERPPIPLSPPVLPPALPAKPIVRQNIQSRPSRDVPQNPVASPAATTLEESIGTRLTTWIGGIAIALAGALMVKYFHDKGLIGPETRLSIAGLIGLFLIAISEPLRRKKLFAAKATAASGVAVLYAVVLGAANLYELISFRTAFIANAVVTAGAVVLSLRHGAFVAVLALVGGLLMPQLLAHEIPELPTIIPYLAILEAAIVWLARKKDWWWLQALLIVGSFLWWIFLLSPAWSGADRHWIGVFAVLSTGISTYSMLPRADDTGGIWTFRGYIGLIGLLMSVLMLLACTAKTNFSASEWTYVGLACVGMTVFERIRRDARWIAMFVEVPTLFMILGFAAAMKSSDAQVFGRVAAAFGVVFLPLNAALAFGHHRPSDFTWRALFLSVGLFIVVYSNHFVYLPPIPWWAIAAIGAVVGAAFSLAYRARGEKYLVSADLAAVVAFVFVVFGELLKLENAIEPIVVVATAVATIEISRKSTFGKTRAVAAAGVVLALLIVVRRQLWWSGLDGVHPIFNEILPAFLIPIAFATIGGYRESAAGRKITGGVLMGSAIFTVVVGLEVFVRNALGLAQRIPAIDRPSFEAVAIIAPLWAAFGYALTRIERPLVRRFTTVSGVVVAIVGVYLPLVAFLTPFSPLGGHAHVGNWPVVNLLASAFVVPAVFAVLIARKNTDIFKNLAPVFLLPALALGFVFVTGLVRHAFHGSALGVSVTTYVTPYDTTYATHITHPGSREYLFYSLSWIAYAVLLLVAGVKTKSSPVRWCSLGVMLVAVLKVFLSDLSELRDLARVFSFFGLGVTLLILSWVYQRFVFVKTPVSGSSATTEDADRR